MEVLRRMGLQDVMEKAAESWSKLMLYQRSFGTWKLIVDSEQKQNEAKRFIETALLMNGLLQWKSDTKVK